MRSAATPDTTAVAKLVPLPRHTPPPTQAPGTAMPGASKPSRWPGPQLLDGSGRSASSWAPTARTPGTEAGMKSHAQPWLPAAATTRASRAAAACSAALRRDDRASASPTWAALMLTTWAPSESAFSMASARASCEQWTCPPASGSSKIGMAKAVHPGARPGTAPSAAPVTIDDTRVPCSMAPLGTIRRPDRASRSTGPSRTATRISARPLVRDQSCWRPGSRVLQHNVSSEASIDKPNGLVRQYNQSVCFKKRV